MNSKVNFELFFKSDSLKTIKNNSGIYTGLDILALAATVYFSKQRTIDFIMFLAFVALLFVLYFYTNKITNVSSYKIGAVNGFHSLLGSLLCNFAAFTVVSNVWHHPVVLLTIQTTVMLITLAGMVLHLNIKIKSAKSKEKQISDSVKIASAIGAGIGVLASKMLRDILSAKLEILVFGIVLFIIALMLTHGITSVLKYYYYLKYLK